jgi:hypothetical protein
MKDHAVSVNGHDVEAYAGVWSNDLHVIGCEPAKSRSFSRVYGRKRRAESIVGTGLYLHEDDRIAVTADQIDLAAGKT